jgi:transposase-like protein
VSDVSTAEAGEPVGERAVPFYCPYCAEEDLRPLDAEPGRYTCGACRRSFALRFLGVASAP